MEWNKMENLRKSDNPLYNTGTIVNIPKKRNVHPTVKPLKLISYLVILGSRENDIVLDPFVGSGTTAISAKILNRNFIGIEINPDYVEIAKKRLANIPSRLETFTLFNKKNGR